MHADSGRRQPHAVLGLASRRHKAAKIERLLGLRPGARPIRMLEIGCGSGGISHYFGQHPSLECDVDAVDVVDNRQVGDGYRFTLVADVELPFADASFDVVITNHVIEHVGARGAQLRHLREVRRVLAPGGSAYLAVPNRWMLVEPHYKLAFLSWLPGAWRTPYLRLMRKGEFYDCEPLRLPELEALLREAGMRGHNLCASALRATFEIERPASWATRMLRRVPDAALLPLRRAIPTLVYRLDVDGGETRR